MKGWGKNQRLSCTEGNTKSSCSLKTKLYGIQKVSEGETWGFSPCDIRFINASAKTAWFIE